MRKGPARRPDHHMRRTAQRNTLPTSRFFTGGAFSHTNTSRTRTTRLPHGELKPCHCPQSAADHVWLELPQPDWLGTAMLSKSVRATRNEPRCGAFPKPGLTGAG